MALYTVSDLHLPLGVNKPMDIFGSAWTNYVTRLSDNWKNTVKPDDTVVLGGDFSWATYLDEATADFEFLHGLPGRKILLKGNHDYWWTTMSKLGAFKAAHGFDDIEFLHNNYVMINGLAVCGTRGWSLPQIAHSEEDRRLYNREMCRLEQSITAAAKENPREIVVFLHFPPLMRDYRITPMTELLKEYGIKRCYYGHIHQKGEQNAFCGESGGITYTLCSCDRLGFMPILVEE